MMELRPSQLLKVGPANPITPHSRYRSGQLVMGTLLKWLGDSLAEVEVGGRKLTANVDPSLKTGVRYPFQVQKEEEGVLHLKILSSNSNPNQALNEILRQSGLIANGRNREFLGRMVEKGWPLVPSFVRKTVELAAQVPRVTDAISIIDEMVGRDLPLHPDVFQAIQQVKLGPDAVQLLNQLETTLQELPGAQADSPKPSQPEQVLKRFLETLKTAGETTGGTEARSPLPQLLEKMGFFHEAIVKELGEQATQSEAKLETMTQARQNETINQTENGEQVTNLKSELLSFLQHQGQSEGHTHHAASELLQHLTGQQLLSLTHDPEWLCLNVQLPIFQEGQGTLARLKWEIKKTPDGGLDAHFCRLVFHVTLTELQETILQMIVQDRAITCSLFTESTQMGDWLNTPTFEEMKTRLKALNYDLVGFHHRAEDLKEVSRHLFYQTPQMDVTV